MFFFFQAEDGIRDVAVTGVQTCALPIYAELSVLVFLRKSRGAACALVVCNFTPVPRDNYRIGVPRAGRWRERLNSDAHEYGGSGIGNFGAVQALALPSHGQPHSLGLHLPPLAILVLTPD